jgi:hypothetical protein
MKDNGGPAFPVSDLSKTQEPGMILRDSFAIGAIGPIIDNATKLLLRTDKMPSVETLAHSAYVLADAMLAERVKE